MKEKEKRGILLLTVFIITLSVIATLTGLLSGKQYELNNVITPYGENIELYQKGLYARNSVSMAIQSLAQDKVTLVLGVPALILSLILYVRKNKKGLFLLTGTMGYFLYTYASYAFLIYYNSLYLVYVALMSASLFAFILCMMNLRREIKWDRVAEHFPRKLVRNFFLIGGLVIGGIATLHRGGNHDDFTDGVSVCFWLCAASSSVDYKEFFVYSFGSICNKISEKNVYIRKLDIVLD